MITPAANTNKEQIKMAAHHVEVAYVDVSDRFLMPNTLIRYQYGRVMSWLKKYCIIHVHACDWESMYTQTLARLG